MSVQRIWSKITSAVKVVATKCYSYELGCSMQRAEQTSTSLADQLVIGSLWGSSSTISNADSGPDNSQS